MYYGTGQWNDRKCGSTDLRAYICKYYPSKEQCRDVMPGSGKCYIPQNEWATWDEGRQHCADRYGGDLAYIGNYATQKHIDSLVSRDLEALRSYSGKVFAWIGMLVPDTDVLHKADGTMAGAYARWISGEPNGVFDEIPSSFFEYSNAPPAEQRYCVHMKITEGGLWNDHYCSETNSYVCEYIPHVPDVDECSVGTHSCDHNCHNEHGIEEYSCSCNPGYQLDTDGHQCLEVISHECVMDFPNNRVLPLGEFTSSSLTHETCIEHCNQADLRCPPGWEALNDYCYFVSDNGLKYSDAKARCESLDSQLTSINSENENNFLTQKAVDAGSALWIGLDDLEVEGTFKWLDGSMFLPSSWHSSWVWSGNNNPDNSGNGDCTEIHDHGAWNDKHCSNSQRFVCKMRKEKHRYVGCYIDTEDPVFPTDVSLRTIQQ
ncbi:uncharacterized protein [Amphiura filiformis]|uniref:uncharacterized protein n=1 Tax=Amphiura filiformis TaxID=82378 RepID=UPI003B20F007